MIQHTYWNPSRRRSLSYVEVEDDDRDEMCDESDMFPNADEEELEEELGDLSDRFDLD